MSMDRGRDLTASTRSPSSSGGGMYYPRSTSSSALGAGGNGDYGSSASARYEPHLPSSSGVFPVGSTSALINVPGGITGSGSSSAGLLGGEVASSSGSSSKRARADHDPNVSELQKQLQMNQQHQQMLLAQLEREKINQLLQLQLQQQQQQQQQLQQQLHLQQQHQQQQLRPQRTVIAFEWMGQIVLKTKSTPITLYCTHGDTSVARLMPSGELKLTQRMRLDSSQCEAVLNDILLQTGRCCTMLPRPKHEMTADVIASLEHIASYLVEKNAAGFLSFPGCSVYIFPPCEQSVTHITRVCPELRAEDYALLFILVAS
jgi:hypothetical protein